MCGICGELFFNNSSPNPNAVRSMMDRMVSRGPDDQGLHQDDFAVLGHRRLKIIDLSDRSAQPMTDDALGLSIVFNGAIYNYRELRQELEELGYTFTSSGDTEVILKAYHAWQERCLARFNGMFAFALFDRSRRRVFLARDRLGIKPLYYARTGNTFRFASSLPALIGTPGIDTRPDVGALHHYLTFHSVVPAPRTILQGVRKCPPAHFMIIDHRGGVSQECYWDLDFRRDREEEGYGFDEWKRLLADTLRQSVRHRLVADVPVGVLLSGGLDSSLVVGLLAEAGVESLKTFSIGFESAGGEAGNEFKYSDIVAREFGTDHHPIEVDSRTLLPALAPCVAAMNEPMVSHDCIGFYLLSQAVSKHVKVVQSGQGADEIFGGYHWYPPLMTSQDPVNDYQQVFFDRSHGEFLEMTTPNFHTGDESLAFVRRHFQAPGADTAIDKALRLDTRVMLVDDPVKRVDSMTMAWGLEARVPFLDHNVVELAAKIPAEHKVRADGKYILKEAARSIIPAAVIDRPKGYFPVPALKYLQGEYLEFVRTLVCSERARQRGIFRQAYLDRLLAEPMNHLTPLRGSKLWQVALLEYWFQTHGL